MSLAQVCRDVVSRYPYMLDCLREDVANYRALARRIKPEVEEMEGRDVDIEAVTTALRRYGENLRDGVDHVEDVKNVLGESRVSLRGNVVTITATEIGEVDVESGFFHLVRGRKFTTAVSDDTHSEKIKRAVKGEIINEDHNLTGIIVESPEDIKEVPGVISHMISRFMMEDINIIDITSCHTETIIIVNKKDAVKALETLEKVIESNQ